MSDILHIRDDSLELISGAIDTAREGIEDVARRVSVIREQASVAGSVPSASTAYAELADAKRFLDDASEILTGLRGEVQARGRLLKKLINNDNDFAEWDGEILTVSTSDWLWTISLLAAPEALAARLALRMGSRYALRSVVRASRRTGATARIAKARVYRIPAKLNERILLSRLTMFYQRFPKFSEKLIDWILSQIQNPNPFKNPKTYELLLRLFGKIKE